MMKWIKPVFAGLTIVMVSCFLHYYLPSRDIVQIVGTEVKRMDIGHAPWFWDRADAGTQKQSTRDVRFINTVWPNGKPRVYRNEDTGWSFPPYFKFNSSNLTAEAQGLDKQGDDIWVAVSHYGWRVEILTMFPNAYKVKKVSGPDALLIPWFNIVFLCFLAFIVLNVWLTLRRFKKRKIDPIADKIEDVVEDASEEITKGGNAIGKAFRRWFGKNTSDKDTSGKDTSGKDGAGKT